MTELKVKTRDTKDNLTKIRKSGYIPAIVYSKGEPGESLAINYIQFEKVYKDSGESSLIDLVLENNKTKKVLVHEVQYEPVKNKILHVDFYEVDLQKKVTTSLEIELIGEAPIVKSEGGIVIKHLDEIEIECLPADLVKECKVDISGLDDFSSVIYVKDLKISDKITILNNPDDIVVNVSEPRKEEEIAAVEAPIDAAAKEAAGERKEGEENKDGDSKKEETKKENKK